ncbi:hypothetical protein A2U01_0117361, partial [Trifolium medium]|nr:hypothetical protein [Trifolium medium]
MWVPVWPHDYWSSAGIERNSMIAIATRR